MMIPFSEVQRIAKERGCKATNQRKYACDIGFPGGRKVNCTAAARELWNPISVFLACRACKEPDGKRLAFIKKKLPESMNMDVTSHGLREDLIAEALAADGVKAYHGRQRTIGLEALLRSENDRRGLAFADVNPTVRDAARAVVDAGLAELTLGPRGGWSLAHIVWTPAARIGGHLTPEQNDALEIFGVRP